jgi:Icc-related predicted phosphoesterase
MRIVAVSDLHGFLPEIPPCDLLIVAGDICPDGVGSRAASEAPALQAAWFDRHVRPWLRRAPAAHTVFTWGNHDFCGESCDFKADRPGRAADGAPVLLIDEATRIDLAPGEGRSGGVTIWASPWSNQFGGWAFMKRPRDLARVYDAIPEGTDIIVSHQPPYGYGDKTVELFGPADHAGSRELLAAIDRVGPRLVVCGHIHEAHGRYSHRGIPIVNASVVNEYYELVHLPTVIDLA